MLKFFSKNLWRKNRGQLAPFFIILLVIVIIMAMVTVNLSKVAFVKTETANSVDAGALAAGSVMANLFNAIGKANERFETSYRDFFDEISNLFIQALTHVISAIIEANKARVEAQQALNYACSDPCTALNKLSDALKFLDTAIAEVDSLAKTMDEIKTSIKNFHEKHLDYYKKIRQLAEDSRQKAMGMGRKFGFMNSGIADKVADRQSFTNFLDSGTSDSYEWFDGQERRHYIEVKVSIDPVEKFELKVTENTYSKEMEIIDSIISLITSAKGSLNMAKGYYNAAYGWLWISCILAQFELPYAEQCKNAADNLKLGLTENDLGITKLKQIIAKIIEAWKGLFPKDGTFTSSSVSDAEDQIICWIEEIIHSHTVRVTSKQEHAGKEEAGIWNARYPEIESFSVVNFEGKGQIHREKNGSGYDGPILRFNASIVSTDTEH